MIGIRQVSKKRARVMRQEKALIQCLLRRCGGLCELCHKPPDWRGLSKDEIKSRAQGGDPLDPKNCRMVCGRCHSNRHGIKEV